MRHKGNPVPLTPKAFETLQLLVERSGCLVEKDDFMQEVWTDAVVEEANLARNIWTLRKALGDDDREHRYIETVPKRDYRFIAPVKQIPLEAVDVIVERHRESADNIFPAATSQGRHKRKGPSVTRNSVNI